MSNISDLEELSNTVRAGANTRVELLSKAARLHEDADKAIDQVAVLEGAKQLLATVSDEALNNTVTYITSIVNKVLNDMFEGTGNEYKINLSKVLYRSRYTHVKLELFEDGNLRDFHISSGMGIRQVISFLYVICLIEESGRRKFLVLDEVLSNLSHDSAEAVGELIKIFADGGFQFVMIDHGNYGHDSILDPYIQRVHIQKVNKVSTVVDTDYEND